MQGELDMRFDNSFGVSAKTGSIKLGSELADVFYYYGEERKSRQYAKDH